MHKKCSWCKTTLNDENKSSVNAFCKLCYKLYNKQRYQNKKNEYRKRHRKCKIQRKIKINKIKNVPCADCGKIFHSWVMEFDHITDDKIDIIGNLVNKSNDKNILNEIKKCEVVCANCHHKRTHDRLLAKLQILKDKGHLYKSKNAKNMFEKRNKFLKLLTDVKSVPCMDCGIMYEPCQMELDHRNPAEKLDNVSVMIGRVAMKVFIDEIKKCDVVCANCHRMRSYKKYCENREICVSSAS